MTRLPVLIVGIALCLSACGAPTDEPSKPPAKPAAAKAKKCPDPDNRDSKDPCSVAYIQRTPSRVSEDALK